MNVQRMSHVCLRAAAGHMTYLDWVDPHFTAHRVFLIVVLQDTYFEFGRPSKCSVVGNSGILNNSSCGEHIDNADFVIRFNVPLINGFRKDVGSRSDVTTINPSQIQNQFGGLIGYQARRHFLNYLKQYHRYIWVSAFASVSTMEVGRSLLRTIRGKLNPSQLLLGNPQHWRSMTRFWRGRGVTGKRLSSGIYWVSNALTFCDEVHLYGFWPFKSNSVGEPIRYHYYTDKPPTTLPSKSHSFSDEFSAILKLHKKGVLQLHADKCD
ncbi:alpha-N-acetylneuraminide alpha-2,8-sialyltransferase-like [Anneissia japonica]|uniref:alpha-N-acetylneuraminide alpha-2,8-sialyltransferase-like n=1 Tax=Anneissia japonica TaxID=1529436 RepID=UPI0014255E2D|nr:alpha-N-acetylneuraminide alpha-2,8-sialyltransferase-like [Anneissia japonica]